MRSLQVGAVLGALCLLGACVPESSPVEGSKQIGQLSGEEVVYLCDWSVDYMGGPDAQHTCPPTEDDFQSGQRTYVETWDDQECQDYVYLLWETEICNQLSVSQFESYVRDVADQPCKEKAIDYSVPGGVCTLSRSFQ